MLKILTRSEPLSITEWLAILENLRERVKPFLDQVTLEKLWDVKFLQPSSGSQFYRSINEIKSLPRIPLSDMEILDTQGIFSCYKEEDGTEKNTLEYYLWGLTRNAEWVTIKVEAYYNADHIFESIQTSLTKTPLETVLGLMDVRGYNLWRHFKIIIEEWERRAKAKSAGIERFAKEIGNENELILHLVTLPTPEKKESSTLPVLA